MTCPACGHANRPGAKFCEECGAAFAAANAQRPSDPSGARKVVSIVFADLVGSTALHERLDPESARRFMESYYTAMRGAVESHGGRVTQLLGDGVKAVFGIPRVAEDDAIRAVRAAVAMQQAFRALAEQQQGAVGKTGLRVAVNSGEVVASGASEIIGDPVNVAARLQEQGRDGDVVIGESTQRLVAALVTLEPLGSFALKGRSGAVAAHRVVSLERPAGTAMSPFVGRESELAQILSVYQTAVGKPATSLAVLLGSPGLGKSRLIDEVARRLGDEATLIRAHCDAAGGASFAPIAAALRALPDLDSAVPGSDSERARILAGIRALLSGSPASPEETFFVLRRLLAALATDRPVVLVLDDAHWAEPFLLDLIEHLVQWGSGVPLLLLVGARPELRESRATLATPGALVSEVVTLAGLDAGAAMRLAANVIGAADLPASVAAKVLATSEGNPLFVGELVRMLVDEGVLKREGGRWAAAAELAALAMPPTIHALLAARIERLQPEERLVLERAAVIGRSFSRSAVAELASRDVGDLDARLDALRRAELIERDTGWFISEPVLRFHHVLIRDAAYRRILKGTRAELHARFADWVEARAGYSIEHDETIGWHLEQAHQLLGELGPIEARGRALGERAARRLAAAGRRALARDDVPLASGLLGRAILRLDREDGERAELAIDWCESLLAAGDVAPAAAALDELERLAAGDARLRAWHTCFAGQLTALTAPQGLNEAVQAVALAASDLAELGDVTGEAKAHFVHAQAFARLGKVGACEAALDRALAAARRAGDRRRANTVLAVAPLAALWGPSPVTRASGRCLDVVRVLRITQGAPAVEAVALSCQGLLEALRGRTDAARRMIASARKMVEELGITQRLLEADVFAARIDLLDGDAAAAERGLRAACDGMRELGLAIDAARAGALLARTLLAQGRVAEAEALSHESERLAGDDLQAAIAWRGARAEALARRGETAEAVALASRAVEMAAATDALLDHADARLALAAALRAAGRGADADSEERRATELWEAKGATLLAERARRAGAHPSSAAAEPESRGDAERPVPRHIRASRATAAGASLEEVIAARDSDALAALLSDPCVVVHHPTSVTYGRREQLSTWKSIFRAEHFVYRREALATLGDSLELWRHWISLSGLTDRYAASFGLSDFEEIVIGEVDGRGRYRRFEIFAADHLGHALASLYERNAVLCPDGGERSRAAAIARSAGVMLGQPDLAGTASVLAPDVEFSDLRTVGFGTLHGAEAVLETIAAMMELSRDDSAHIDDVLVLEPDALVVRWTNRGTDVESGGAFERNLCQLWTFDSAGLLSLWQQFEVEHDAEALLRFDERFGAGRTEAATEVFENAAARADRELFRCFNARDWNGVLACAAPELVFDERRRMVRNTCGREVWLEQFRILFDVPESRFRSRLIATRGERLALNRHCFQGEVADGGGPLSMEDQLALHEIDREGRITAIVLFDEDDPDAAYAELDLRFQAGEGESHAGSLAIMREFERAVASGCWDPVLALCSPALVEHDHRPLAVLGTTRGAEAWVRNFRVLADLAPDSRYRVDHFRSTPRGFCSVGFWNGTREGGPYELPLVAVIELDGQDRIARADIYDADQLERARARFEELEPTCIRSRSAP